MPHATISKPQALNPNLHLLLLRCESRPYIDTLQWDFSVNGGRWSHVTRHTSHITRHMSNFTRHTSHVTQVHERPSHGSCKWNRTQNFWRSRCQFFRVKMFEMCRVTCDVWRVTCDVRRVMCDVKHGMHQVLGFWTRTVWLSGGGKWLTLMVHTSSSTSTHNRYRYWHWSVIQSLHYHLHDHQYHHYHHQK